LRDPTEELEDRLTDLDPPYESEQERQIGRMLDQYGIPFFYRQPTIVYQDGQNELWKPAFTLPSYGGLVVDYAPGSGQPDLDKPNWGTDLSAKLEQLYRQALDPMRYTQGGQ